MTKDDVAKCIVSVEIARGVANQFNCLTEEENANIDKVVQLLASSMVLEHIKEEDSNDENKES